MGGGGQVGGHKPVPRCWVGDIERGVVLQHLEEEGGLHGGIVGEAGAQWVDHRRGAIAEVPGGRESRGVSGVALGGSSSRPRAGWHLHGGLHVAAGGAAALGDLQQPVQQHRVRGHTEVEEPGAAVPVVEGQLLRGLGELLGHQPGVCREGTVRRPESLGALPGGQDGERWRAEALLPGLASEKQSGEPWSPWDAWHTNPDLGKVTVALEPLVKAGAQKLSLRNHVLTHVCTSIFLTPAALPATSSSQAQSPRSLHPTHQAPQSTSPTGPNTNQMLGQHEVKYLRPQKQEEPPSEGCSSPHCSQPLGPPPPPQPWHTSG